MENCKKLSVILMCICLFSLKVVATNTVSFRFSQPTLSMPGGINSNNGRVDSTQQDNFKVVAHDASATNGRADFHFVVRQSALNGGSQFKLYNGGSSLPVTVSVRSQYSASGAAVSSREAVLPSTPSSAYKGASAASDSYGNSEIHFLFSDLIFDLREGVYEGDFSVDVVSGSVTATQNITVRYTVAPLVQISGLKDLALAWSDRNAEYIGSEHFCIFSTTSQIAVTARGDGNGQFLLHHGESTLSYTVLIMSSDALGDSIPLTANTRNVMTHFRRVNCANSDNVTLTIESGRAPVSAITGVYTGTLFLTVEAE